MRAVLVSAVLACVIGLGACDPVPSPAPAPRAEVASEPWVPAVTRDETVRLFPEAASVWLRVHDGGYTEGGERIYSNPDGVHLTEAQRDRVDAAFIKRVTVAPERGQPPEGEIAVAAACFIPHHFFEYRDDTGEVLGEVAVCFCCEGAQVSPYPVTSGEAASLIEDVAALKVLVTDMGLPTDVDCYE